MKLKFKMAFQILFFFSAVCLMSCKKEECKVCHKEITTYDVIDNSIRTAPGENVGPYCGESLKELENTIEVRYSFIFTQNITEVRYVCE